MTFKITPGDTRTWRRIEECEQVLGLSFVRVHELVENGFLQAEWDGGEYQVDLQSLQHVYLVQQGIRQQNGLCHFSDLFLALGEERENPSREQAVPIPEE